MGMSKELPDLDLPPLLSCRQHEDIPFHDDSSSANVVRQIHKLSFHNRSTDIPFAAKLIQLIHDKE